MNAGTHIGGQVDVDVELGRLVENGAGMELLSVRSQARVLAPST